MVPGKPGSLARVHPHSPESHKPLARLIDLTALGRPAPDLGRATTAWEEGATFLLPPEGTEQQSPRLITRNCHASRSHHRKLSPRPRDLGPALPPRVPSPAPGLPVRAGVRGRRVVAWHPPSWKGEPGLLPARLSLPGR